MGPSSNEDFDWDENNNQDNSSLAEEKTMAESHGGPEESPWKLRFFFQEPNHGNIQTYIDESFKIPISFP
jgi:hypothetical protein